MSNYQQSLSPLQDQTSPYYSYYNDKTSLPTLEESLQIFRTVHMDGRTESSKTVKDTSKGKNSIKRKRHFFSRHSSIESSDSNSTSYTSPLLDPKSPYYSYQNPRPSLSTFEEALETFRQVRLDGSTVKDNQIHTDNLSRSRSSGSSDSKWSFGLK